MQYLVVLSIALRKELHLARVEYHALRAYIFTLAPPAFPLIGAALRGSFTSGKS